MGNKTEKRARFENVASNRVKKTLSVLDSLSKCSNKNNYEYDKGDVDKMMNVIKEKLKLVENAYRQNLNKRSADFKF